MKKKVRDIVELFREFDSALDQASDKKSQQKFYEEHKDQSADLQRRSDAIKDRLLGLEELSQSGETYSTHFYKRISILLSANRNTLSQTKDLEQIHNFLASFLDHQKQHSIDHKIRSALQVILRKKDNNISSLNKALRYIDLIALIEYSKAEFQYFENEQFNLIIKDTLGEIQYYLDLMKVSEDELSEWVSLTMNFSSKAKKRLSITRDVKSRIENDWKQVHDFIQEISNITDWNQVKTISWLWEFYCAISNDIDWVKLGSDYLTFKLLKKLRSDSNMSDRELYSNLFKIMGIIRPKEFASDDEFYRTRKIEVEDEDRYRQFQVDQIRRIIDRFM